MRRAFAGLVLVLFGTLAPALAQTGALPPRSISDVLAILDQQKPNFEVVAERQRVATEQPPANAEGLALAQFYYKRAQARSALGRVNEAISDAGTALGSIEPTARFAATVRSFLAAQYAQTANGRKLLELLAENQREQSPANVKLNAKGTTVRVYVTMGDLANAQTALQELESFATELRRQATNQQIELYSEAWNAAVENAQGQYLSARGRWKEAEESLVKADVDYREAIIKRPRWPNGPELPQMRQVRDRAIVELGQVRRAQGRLAEAEVDMRRALLSQLEQGGKYHPVVAAFCLQLGDVMRDQGRFVDYERLARQALDIARQLGFSPDANLTLRAEGALANALRLQERWPEAAAAMADVENSMKSWEPARRSRALSRGVGRSFILYNTGRVDDGIKAAEQVVALARSRFGTKHFDYALAVGTLGIGQSMAGRDEQALASFHEAVPLLASESGEEDDSEGMPGARQRQSVRIIAAYITLLARQAAYGDKAKLAEETFALSDLLRGHSVASAVAASSARAASQDPALAELARREQDLRKQLAANVALLNSTLALPPDQRSDQAVTALREDVTKLREQHTKARLEIGVRFPAYDDLVDPKPATVPQIQAALRSKEAFVSFYFGPDGGFVWVIPKGGRPTFATIVAKGSDIESRVRKLREALEPNASTVSDIPAFDVVSAHALYELLLKPVETAWRPANTLVVATNGALGLLPLGVLPTAPVSLPPDKGAAFSTYRAIPWLARTHAVDLVPSAAAFRTLRGLPAAGSGRQPLIGFGDPLFNKEQVDEVLKETPPAPAPASAPLDRRSAPHVDNLASATLTSLPRLPDTADELKSVAGALKTDPARILKLGLAANEETVRSTDLSKYRVVAFATHGLVAGELDGLTQPALALSAPALTGGKGDGLLTLEEILSLKLDADWVLLSACNTGAGDGAGAEAASGLGRAFFYAGTRAILVTNWSVHSQSARDLVADLLSRQAADPKLTRAEALRRAEIALMDGPGFVDDKGQTIFSYAHPLFWAPYSIIGDGG